MKLGSVTWGDLLAPPGDDANISSIDRAVELGLEVITAGFREPSQQNPDYMKKIADYAASKGVELRTGGGGRWGSANPEERKADIASTIERLIRGKRYAGIKNASIPNMPMVHNRWAPDPPMSERIDIIADSLGQVADGVASEGIQLALENHCDYRGHEIAAMIAKANRPNLGAQIDTGNAFCVFEDPVDCAKALAKHVVSVHLKDIKVTPFIGRGPVQGIRGENAPLGEGQVDNATIMKLLQEQSPNPKNMAVMLEPLTTVPEAEREYYVQTSLAWCRKNLAQYL